MSQTISQKEQDCEDFDKWMNEIFQMNLEKPDMTDFDRRVNQLRNSLRIEDENNN
jgi:hypothetical protein